MSRVSNLILVLALTSSALARLRNSFGPEDTYAFPKFRLNFVNNRPISPQDAKTLLAKGLSGGEDEFFGRTSPKQHGIEGSGEWIPEEGDAGVPLSESKPQYQLQYMKLGAKHQYLCLLPDAPDQKRIEPEEPEPVDPSKSWALLAPLTGSCLYHRQGWFTYSYCHNQYVRQFRELEHTHPHPPGGRIPQEDPEFQAYTLGQSPAALAKDETDLSTPEQQARVRKELQLAQGGGQRYLTSRWTDGTICDKTGKRREVEVQFHCGMTSTDSIQFLKETSVCKYLLVLHTPRLCGEPGFQSVHLLQPSTPIHCREILEPAQAASLIYTDPQTKFPYADNLSRNPIHLPNYAIQQEKKAKAKAGGLLPGGTGGSTKKHADALKKAISELLGGKGTGAAKGGREGERGRAANTKGATTDDLKYDLDDLDDMSTIAVQGDDGEEVYVQVLDIEGDDYVAGDLRAQIDEALIAALTKHRKKSKKGQDTEEGEGDEDTGLYYDDVL